MPSRIQLFHLLLLLRWALVLFLPVQVVISDAANQAAWAGIALAMLYTLVLTMSADWILRLGDRGVYFLLVDMLVVSALYATGAGTAWPFLLFSSTTLLFWGLAGTIRVGVFAAVVWSGIAMLAQSARGASGVYVLGIAGLEDLFYLGMISGVWAYCVGLASHLNEAYDQVRESEEDLRRVNADLDRREKGILGIMEVGRTAIGEGDVTTIARSACEVLERTTPCSCEIWLLSEDRLSPASGDARPLTLAASDPIARAVRLHRTVTGTRAGGPDVDRERADAGTAVTVVPIAAGDDIFGALAVRMAPAQAGFGDSTEMLELFAAQVALALRHVRYVARTRELAIVEERGRIADEIHGAVIQKVHGASLLAEAVREDVAPEVPEWLDTLCDTTRCALRDLRLAVLDWDSLAWRLPPGKSVKRYAGEFSSVSGIPIHVHARGARRPLDDRKTADLLRILQEALSNVWRHADATSVDVDVDSDAEGVVLVVKDDGCGFDPATAERRPEGGLVRIRERSSRDGGSTDMESSPGTGTTVRVWMPR